MKDELKNINLLIDEFNKIAFIAQRKAFIIIASEIQKEEIETIEAYRNSLFELKRKYVEHELNEEANLTFCLEQSLQSIQYELQMLINIKEDNMNEAWNNLVKAQVTYESVARNCPYESISANGYMRKLEYYEKILFPGMMFASIGGIIKKSHCSICNESYNKCNHIKGKLYNGEMCVRMVTEMELEEVSLVDIPANKQCRVLTTTYNGKTVDSLTLREIEKTNDE